MELSCSGRVYRAGAEVGLAIDRGAACQGCAGVSGCGSRLLESSANSALLFELPAGLKLESGAEVTLLMPARGLGLLVSFCYIVPAFMLLLGAWFGSGLTDTPDSGAFAGALVGLVVGSCLLRLYDASGGGQAWFRRIKISSGSRAVSQA
jgi:positive regulator of sigma E activity